SISPLTLLRRDLSSSVFTISSRRSLSNSNISSTTDGSSPLLAIFSFTYSGSVLIILISNIMFPPYFLYCLRKKAPRSLLLHKGRGAYALPPYLTVCNRLHSKSYNGLNRLFFLKRIDSFKFHVLFAPTTSSLYIPA